MKINWENSIFNKIPKKIKIIAAAVIAAVVVVVAVSASFVMVVSRTRTVELGEVFDLSKIADTAFCSVGESDVDTDKVGDYTVELEFFGFIGRKMQVCVRDTTTPAAEVYNVSTVLGSELSCEDFVKSVFDLSEVSYSFEGGAPDTDTVGEKQVTLLISDEFGNTLSKTAELEVTDKSDALTVECGENDLQKVIADRYPDVIKTDISDVDSGTPGIYTVTAYSDDTYRVFFVSVEDGDPPTADPLSCVLRKGETVTADKLVQSVDDVSDVTVRFADEVDFTKTGETTVKLILEDKAGNVTELATKIGIYDIPEKISLEYGFTSDDLEDALFSKIGANKNPFKFKDGFSADSLKLGKNEIVLVCELGELSVEVTVEDTRPPKLTLKMVTVSVGEKVEPRDFVKSCVDNSRVTYSFAKEPSFNAIGMMLVTIVATDEGGNVTEKTAVLSIIKNATPPVSVPKDTTPPVIYGIKDLSVVSLQNISYVRGVYAVDNVDGNVTVNVDSSKINLDVNGVYTVYYTASDSAGNTATASAKVTVNIVTLEDTVNSTADTILTYIVNDSMTDRDKAWAIYSWVTANFRYSNSTSYLMGHFYEGASSGFNIRSGNCYIYYAVTRVLLNRAGIENLEIQRDDPAKPHYWNMVKIDGSWYHLDTCPHYSGHKITAFLLTDADLKHYSETEVKGYYSFDASKYPATP